MGLLVYDSADEVRYYVGRTVVVHKYFVPGKPPYLSEYAVPGTRYSHFVEVDEYGKR